MYLLVLRLFTLGGPSSYGPRPRRNADSAFQPTSLAKRTLCLLALTLSASASFGQNVSVAGSTGANGSYATLRAAFTAINGNGTQAGNNISVTIVANTTETASADTR